MRDDLDLRELDRALAGEPADPAVVALVRDVRAQAPRLTPAQAARLDARVARAARTSAEPRWRRWEPLRASALAAACLVLLVGGVVGVAGLADRTGDRPAAGGGGGGGEAATEAAPAGVDPSVGATGARRRVARDADLVLLARDADLQRVSDQVVRAADRFGAIVARSDVATVEGRPTRRRSTCAFPSRGSTLRSRPCRAWGTWPSAASPPRT